MQKYSIWPTEIFSFTDVEIDHSKIKDTILEKEKKESSRDKSNVGGWQSDDNLFDLEFILPVKEFLNDCIGSILQEQYREEEKLKAYFKEGWANVNRQNNFNMPHTHPGSTWSCVYYLTDVNNSTIYFCDPRIGNTLDGSLAYTKENAGNMISPKSNNVGDAMFFPSWLQHGVRPNLTEEPRVSISCNFFIGK